MFQKSRTKIGENRSLTGGGLPTFTPQRVAQALTSDKPQDESPVHPQPSRATITIDLATAVRGVAVAVDFFGRRAAQRKEAQKKLTRTTLELAASYQGLVGVPDLLMHTHCSRLEAQTCLTRLEQGGACRFLCTYRDEPLYVFPAYLPRVWSCDYCAGQWAVTPETAHLTACSCPGCGAGMSQTIAP